MHSKTIAAFAALLSVVGCGLEREESPVGDGAVCGKCDDFEEAAGLDPRIPGEAAVRRIYRDAVRDDGRVDAYEAGALSAFTKRFRSRNQRVSAFLAELARDPQLVTSDARAVLESAVSGAREGDVPLDNDVYRVELGGQEFLFDDDLYLLADGAVAGDTGLVSHSRGYAAKRDGVLFTRHGSLAPHYASTSSIDDTSRLREQGPDEALDRAAAAYGVTFDAFGSFSAIARDPNYYDPSTNTPFWAGICQGWTHNALDNRLSLLVDVEGPEGERGLWIFGQWISRADLGNAIMGASYSIGIADSNTIDSFVKPDTLVKGLAQYVLRSGSGLRVDIWNDSHNASGVYNPQIWNQPIVGGSVEVASLPADVADAIIAHADADPSVWAAIPEDARARFVRATAQWGVEANDGWEGEALYRDSTWNMYMITDVAGRVLKGYMAFELADAGITGLPHTTSDGLPDYMAYPKHEVTDASLEAGGHRLLDSGHSDGVRFRFLVGTVLARGIPNTTRAAFEAEVFSGAADAEALAADYPGIANAYSRGQWERTFEPILGPGEDFGAVWDEAGQP